MDYTLVFGSEEPIEHYRAPLLVEVLEEDLQ